MSINRVIVNSSPLIVLFKSQQAELLPQLFPGILVPEGVFAEVTMAGEDDAAARQLPNVAWIQTVKVTSIVRSCCLGFRQGRIASVEFGFNNY
jgi:predicted nucleic acid-binding protein